MAMIKCPECGKDISDKADKCPNCGYPIGGQTVSQSTEVQKSTRNKKVKKKDSKMSIIAAICAFFTFSCLIGLIIGIVDIAVGKKEERHLGSWFAVIFGAVYSVLIFIYFYL